MLMPIEIPAAAPLKNVSASERLTDIPPKDRWYEVMDQPGGPEKLMSHIYWFKSQLPPSDPGKWQTNWQSIVRQLNAQHPAPPQVFKAALAYQRE
jgi:hypothetical protein